MSAVVEMPTGTGILIWMIYILTNADVLDHWIDFHRIDPADSKSQCMIEIIARAGTNDQHVLKWLSPAVSLQQMDERIGPASLVKRHHLLVADGIYRDGVVFANYRMVRRPTRFMAQVVAGQ